MKKHSVAPSQPSSPPAVPAPTPPPGPRSAKRFSIGDRVRYRPGSGTYGYEDVLEPDGRMAASVMGFTRTRVRIQFTAKGRLHNTTRAVDAASLKKADAELTTHGGEQ